jgi:hypothetical protein
VRSLGLESAFHLTTGTFNLFVKDPIALRLSGAFRYPYWTKAQPGLLESGPGASSEAAVPKALAGFRDEPYKHIASFDYVSTDKS